NSKEINVEKNNETFVTYKWLIGTVIVVVGTLLGFYYFNIEHLSANIDVRLDAKVDKSLYDERTNRLCSEVIKLQEGQDKVMDKLRDVEILIKRQNRQ
ncbi:MAG: hypothetical protein KKH61_21480, partial [Gammaproteobacteria bacterium]|nr:hypothetical protein [Gammaproteobacteria bacterium]